MRLESNEPGNKLKHCFTCAQSLLLERLERSEELRTESRELRKETALVRKENELRTHSAYFCTQKLAKLEESTRSGRTPERAHEGG